MASMAATSAFAPFMFRNGWLFRTDAEATAELLSRVNTSIPDDGENTEQERIDEYVSANIGSHDLQTPAKKHSRATELGTAKDVATERSIAPAGLSELVRATDVYINSTRNVIYSVTSENAADVGGGEGIEALDLDMRSGAVWDPLDTTAIRFKIYDVMTKGFGPAKRPGRGGTLAHRSERHATIRVLNHHGEPILGTTDFVLESVTRPSKERFHPQITFDEVIARFGTERIKVYSYTGKLLDSPNFDWMRQWDMIWDRFLRGEVLARNLWRAYILYKGKIVGGYMLSTNIQESVAGPAIPFSFTMLVVDDDPIPDLILISGKQEADLYLRFGGSEEEFNSRIASLGSTLTSGLSEHSGPNEAAPGEETTYTGDENA